MSKHSCAIEYYAPLEVYDENYERLLSLLPDWQQLVLHKPFNFYGSEAYTYTLLEQTRYTSTVRLTADWQRCSKLIPAIEMTVRLYHDAGAAEVLSYQKSRYFKVEYEYPNPSMYSKREKRRLNEFLRDWLACCVLASQKAQDKVLIS